MSEERTGCYDCGRQYGDEYGFPDLMIPDDAWLQISPRGSEGGLLCPSCICGRLHKAGIQCPGWFMSGPLVCEMHADVAVSDCTLTIKRYEEPA